MSTETPRQHGHTMQATYRYLRLAIILLTALLAFSVLLQVIADDGVLLISVSAYYYTGAQDVFVASLAAIGACLIIYRGRSATEDILLNVSGYLAFFVAFVPTSPVLVSMADDGARAAPVTVPPGQVDAVVQNTWALLAAGAIGLILEVALTPQRERLRHSRGARFTLATSAVGYLVLAGWFMLGRGTFLDFGHEVAAVLLFAGVIGVVGVNAVACAQAHEEECAERGEDEPPIRRYLNRYTYGFAIMILTVVICLLVLRPLVHQWVFIMEAALIAQFLGFWITQTVERWNVPDIRADRLVPG